MQNRIRGLIYILLIFVVCLAPILTINLDVPDIQEVGKRTIWYNSDGIGKFNLPSHIRGWVEEWEYTGPASGDCDDYALQMIKDAWTDNFIMGFVLSSSPAHMKVCAIWDNNIYFIEPQAKRVFRVYDNSYWVLDK